MILKIDKYIFKVKITNTFGDSENSLHVQRIGVVLGLMAWCMQIVILIQPLLPGQSIPGLGVCQVIVDAFTQPQSQPLTASNQLSPHHQSAQGVSRHASHSTGHSSSHATASAQPRGQQASALQHLNDQHQLTQPRYITQSTLPLSSYPQADHHFSHLSCGFCILYGHAIPPPDAPEVWSVFAISELFTVAPYSDYKNNIFAADYLQPKSRAPPAFYFNQA